MEQLPEPNAIYKEAGYIAALVVSGLVSLIVLFKLIRPHFNKKVVCWFCHKPSSVPYGNRNCWDCVYCEQYNGFTKDGGYNKPIPSQYEEDLNHTINCTEKADNSKYPQLASKLCDRCNRNQLLKIKQLANFTPSNETRFNEEIELYQAKLEKAYRLCFQCERNVSRELRRQNELLRPKLMTYHQRNQHALQPTLPSEQIPEGGAVHLLSPCVKLISLSLVLLNLFLVLLSLPAFGTLASYVTALHSVLKSYGSKLQLSGLLIQLVTMLLNVVVQRKQLIDFLKCVLWLFCYGHGVLATRLLLPKLLASQWLPVMVLTVILVLSWRGLRKDRPTSGTRPPSPADTWSSVVSNHSYHSDSGISESHPNVNEAACEEYEAMDCTPDLSALNLGGRSPSRNQYTHIRPSTPATPLVRPSALSSGRSAYGGSVHSFHTGVPSVSTRSVYGGSVQSFHTGAPSVSNSCRSGPRLRRSPSRSSVYSQPMNYIPSAPGVGFDAMSAHLSTPPSVSNYMSAGSSPDSPTSTIYSHMPLVPMNQRVAPEKTSLLTQILLGISLGVNISIGAFILGRYSVNGDLLSFI